MRSDLDRESYTFGRRWTVRKSIHHIGESLSKIEKSVGRLARAATEPTDTGHADPAQLLAAGLGGQMPRAVDTRELTSFGIDHEFDDPQELDPDVADS